MFFSRNKSANNTFQLVFSAKQTGPMAAGAEAVPIRRVGAASTGGAGVRIEARSGEVVSWERQMPTSGVETNCRHGHPTSGR